MYGGLARYINHSCEPNCYTKVFSGPDGVARMGIYAKRDIDLGEELAYDYMVGVTGGADMDRFAAHAQHTEQQQVATALCPGLSHHTVDPWRRWCLSRQLCIMIGGWPTNASMQHSWTEPDKHAASSVLSCPVLLYSSCSLSLRRVTAACPAAVEHPAAVAS